MGAEALAQRIRARELLRLHRETYRVFWRWSDATVDYAMLNGSLRTVFGWRVQVPAAPNDRSLRNFSMQANGAEMLRLACCLATEWGIEVCAPVHDAVLICAPLDRLDAVVARMQDAMREASRIVLNGFELRTDATVVRHPDRYMDERGTVMWSRVMALLDNADANTLNTPDPPDTPDTLMPRIPQSPQRPSYPEYPQDPSALYEYIFSFFLSFFVTTLPLKYPLSPGPRIILNPPNIS
jgi:hypothetical protein